LYVFFYDNVLISFIDEFDVQVGIGAYGVVRKARHKATGKEYGIKRFANNSMVLASIREIQIGVLNIQSPFLVKYEEFNMTQKSSYIVMDYCHGGDLGKIIRNNYSKGIGFTQVQIDSFIIQMAFALKTLHDKNVIHRDLCEIIFFFNCF
jgi:serine/threonine protein kinase